MLREAELARRLAREVEKAERVEPLLRRLEEAKAALSGAHRPSTPPTLALALALALVLVLALGAWPWPWPWPLP